MQHNAAGPAMPRRSWRGQRSERRLAEPEKGMKVPVEQRVAVLALVDQGQLTAAAAAARLELSERLIRRLVARYRQGGAPAMKHGNRGRQPAHTISAEVRQQVVALAQSSTQPYTPEQLSRFLAEREGVNVSRSSVRRILAAAGLVAIDRQ